MKEIKTSSYIHKEAGFKDIMDTGKDVLSLFPAKMIAVATGKPLHRSMYGNPLDFESNAFKQKLVQIASLINSDPKITKFFPRLGSGVRDMRSFLAQQKKQADEQEEAIAMARYRRQKQQDRINSGELKYKTTQEPAQVAQVPTEQVQAPTEQVQAPTQELQ